MQSIEVRRQPAWIRFFLNITLAIVIFTFGVFFTLLLWNSSLIKNQIKTQAVAHIRQIVKTREWNAHYGGVYVEKKEGMESNPYLDNPDMEAKDGKIYTLKNPALMTREISRLFEKDGTVTFHMTSLKPINPENTPDKFEENALRRFEKGEKEADAMQTTGDATSYRYMVPLYVKEECLQCHAKQGYRPGDIRGGISVTFDITNVARSLKFNNSVILSLGLISAAALLGFMYCFTMGLMKKLDKAQERIKEMAVTDDLTGLYNRRFLYSQLRDEMERAKRLNLNLSCVLLDIDLFKQINDSHGHPAGDLVLKRISGVVKSCCRGRDLCPADRNRPGRRLQAGG